MGSTAQTTLIFFITFFTLLFCAVIAYDIAPFLRGPAPYPPDWQWDYLFSNTVHKIWAPFLVMATIVLFAYDLEKKSEKYIATHEKRILFVCVLLFFLIQLSVTYFSRAGIGVLFSRIANPDMNGYFTAANSIENVSLFLSQFKEQVLSLPMHAQGHPPGAILVFWVLEQILRPLSPFFSFLDRMDIARGDVLLLWKSLTLSEKLTAVFAPFFIAFLASLSSIFVYYIGKYAYSVRVGIRSAILLLTIPSLILFIPINDVFLPLFPLASFLYLIKGIREEKTIFLFLSGFLFSVGLFFSLSLAPLLFVFAVYVLWRKDVLRTFFPSIQFSIGLLIFPLFLFLLYDFNTIAIFQTLLSGLPENRAYLTWVFFNVSDFFIFLGIPLFVLSLFQLLQIAREKRFDPLTIGFIGMFLILDISGIIRGEVARIWIPYYPFLAIILSAFLTKQIKIEKKLFLCLLCLQFLQILAMQEFWVMLW